MRRAGSHRAFSHMWPNSDKVVIIVGLVGLNRFGKFKSDQP
jgi:hypothetical protein